MKKRRSIDIDSFTLIDDEYGGKHMVYESGDIIARNIKPETVTFFWSLRVVVGMYDIPVYEGREERAYPCHFFVYVVDHRKTYIFRKNGVVLSSVYSSPICFDDGKIQILTIRKEDVIWDDVAYVGDEQRIYKNRMGRVCVESLLSSADFKPSMILQDRHLIPEKYPEVRDYLWKHLYYGITKGLFQLSAYGNLRVPKEDTIKDIKGYILSVSLAKVKCQAKRDFEKEKNEYTSDTEKLISEIDLKIQLLEAEEKWREEHEGWESEDNRMIDEINDDYSVYDFCDEEMLHELWTTCSILEDHFRIDGDVKITYLLLRLIYITKMLASSHEEMSFPSRRTNVFLSETIIPDEKSALRTLQYELCRRWAGGIDVEFFTKSLQLCRGSEVECRKNGTTVSSKSHQVIYSESEENTCNRIGWIGCDKQTETGCVLYAEEIPFGVLNDKAEMHSERQYESIKRSFKDYRITEVYYDVRRKLYCMQNHEEVSISILLNTLREMEGGYVEVVLNMDESNRNDHTILSAEECGFEVTLGESIDKYQVAIEGDKRYAGHVLKEGKTLEIYRYRADKAVKKEYEVGEQERVWDYRIMWGENSDSHFIESVSLDSTILEIIVKLFGIRKWRWNCLQERKDMHDNSFVS